MAQFRELFMANGKSIEKIEKTATDGLIDTYTIYYTDETTSSFTVTNGAAGRGIAKIEKESSNGLIDTYTIHFTDNTTWQFNVTNGKDGSGDGEGGGGEDGRGIVNILLAKTDETTRKDEYTITYTDGTTSTFTVTNGEQGPQGPQGIQGEQGPQGPQGIAGVGIKTITSGNPNQTNGYTATPITVTKTDNTPPEIFYVFAKNGTGGNTEDDEVIEATLPEYFDFTLLEDDTYEIKAKDINNIPPVVVIPSIYNDKVVTSLGDEAFKDCTNLTSIEIPNSINSVGNEAFSGCSNLQYKVEDNLKYLGNTKNPYLYLDSVTTQEITAANINKSCKIIGFGAFGKCINLTSIEIPSSVTSIGEGAFADCFSLTEAIIPNSVTAISNHAFFGCGLKSIIIPNSITSIGQSAFLGCDFTSIKIPNSVTSIGDSAFWNCINLTEVKFSENSQLTTIEFEAFCFCTQLTSVDFGENSQLTSIGERAFYGCISLTSVAIPNSVTSIPDNAFYECYSLTSVVIGNSVTSIGSYAFYKCNSLTSVVIGDSVTSIGEGAFYGCSRLTSVVIGDNVTSIGDDAFEGCSKLVEVINKSLYITVEKGSESNGYVGYYALSVSNRDDSYVSKLTNDNGYIVYTDGEENILVGYSGSKTDLVLPEYLTQFYPKIFSKSLTSVVIGNLITSIPDNAFYECYSLTSVEIPTSVTSIGNSAFNNCDSLTSVEIPDSVTLIGRRAFYSCSSLTSVVIPDSVTSIGEEAFFGCYKLTIYCEAESQPEGWASSWNSSNRPVEWGYQTVSEVARTVDRIVKGEKKIKLRLGDDSVIEEVEEETGEKIAKIKGEVVYIESTFNGEQGTETSNVTLGSGCVNIAADEQINFTAREGATTFFNGNVSFHNAKVEGLPSSGDSKAIVDVGVLPTENVNENVIYRVPSAMFYHVVQGKLPTDQFLCNVVDTLPEVGNPVGVFDDSFNVTFIEGYYVASENKAYGYVDNMLSQIGASLGQTIPVGWYSLEVLFPVINQSYGGIINSSTEATDISSIYLLVEYGLFIYKNGIYTQPSVDTNADYTWNGTHTFNSSVSFNKEVFFNGAVNFSNATVTGGGLTKTKVTLAELQALITTENLGMMVSMYCKKSIPLRLNTVVAPVLKVGYSDFSSTTPVIYNKATTGISSGAGSTFSITEYTLRISSSEIYCVEKTVTIDLATGTTTTNDVALSYLTDDNFDFYVYN